mgnify:CR=1 FL=1
MQSIVDLAKINMSFPILATSLYLAAKGEMAAAVDLKNKGFEGLTGLMYPALRETINPILGVTEYHPEIGTEFMPISDSHATIIESLGGEVRRNEDNKPYGSAKWRALFSAAPGFIATIPRLVSAAKTNNTGLDDGVVEMTKSFLANYSRWERSYPIDVNVEMARRQKAANVQLSTLKKKAENFPEVKNAH